MFFLICSKNSEEFFGQNSEKFKIFQNFIFRLREKLGVRRKLLFVVFSIREIFGYVEKSKSIFRHSWLAKNHF